MKGCHFISVGLIAVGAFASSAVAQVNEAKPTPENAQKFLAKVLVEAPFVDGRADVLLPSPVCCDKYYTSDGRRWENFPASQIESAVAKARTFRIVSWSSAGDVCQSQLVIEGQAVVLTGPQIKGMYTGWWASTHTFGQAGNRSITIDWSKVSSASVSGNAVDLTTTQPIGSGFDSLKGANQIRLILPDEGLATRAGFAAEVIRLKCDTANDLGF